MVSVNNSASSSYVLSNLKQINASLQTTQNRIASGLKVASARDNASVWATAQSIRTDIKAADGINGNVAIGKAQAETAYEALTAMADIITKMQDVAGKLVANAPGNVEVQKELVSYRKQLIAVAQGASFQGVNLVTGEGVTASKISTTIGQDAGTAIALEFDTTTILADDGLSGSLTGSAYASVYSATAFDGATETAINITTFKDALATGLDAVNDYAARVASYSDSLSVQQEFLTKIADIRNNALSALVDADMEKESANISALQVKQQLAYQALSITSNSAQNILRLFQ